MSKPACTACQASSVMRTGAPKKAMMQSPMYLSTMPRRLTMTSTMPEK